ncbi:hypothetical protein CLV58_115138 [Spirosoma oryzae]|uniref:Mobilization protein MobC n=1 Tax=Spirosoma oryzae TaxID=1469603 RepID=A0A2T0SNS7_9BACT|nr:hypothetical protein [Spirosoma oryzae]PRY35055.1 hypothetical protein CLV58_115138 [Spirosoma oryzae]
MENTRNTGGRPELPPDQQSTKRINVRLTQEEYEAFVQRRETVQSKDMSDFIRCVILDRPLPVKEAITTYQSSVLSQLAEIRDDVLRIGVNVNQSVKRINSMTDYRDLQRETANLSGQVERLNSQLTTLIKHLATPTDGRADQ